MKRAGYDLSILRGRHHVKMGFARAWDYVTYRFNPASTFGGSVAIPAEDITGVKQVVTVNTRALPSSAWQCPRVFLSGEWFRHLPASKLTSAGIPGLSFISAFGTLNLTA